jgi:hypothetical protein
LKLPHPGLDSLPFAQPSRRSCGPRNPLPSLFLHHASTWCPLFRLPSDVRFASATWTRFARASHSCDHVTPRASQQHQPSSLGNLAISAQTPSIPEYKTNVPRPPMAIQTKGDMSHHCRGMSAEEDWSVRTRIAVIVYCVLTPSSSSSCQIRERRPLPSMKFMA